MAVLRVGPEFVLSPLDRLIDDAPEADTQPRPRGVSSLDEVEDPAIEDKFIKGDHRRRGVGTLEQVKLSIYENLVWLLNSQQPLVALPPGRHPLQRSLLAYGLPDFTHLGMETADDQELLRTAIQSAIRRFEPRLSRVSVSAPEVVQQSRNLRFQIVAVLNVKPAPEVMTFDSMLLLPARKFELRG